MNIRDISKADWKLFRERLTEWQERYMERLTKEYIELLSSSDKASDRFWALEERIKSDKKHPGVILRMNKAEVVWDIAMLVKTKVVTIKELEGFSQGLIESVGELLEHRSMDDF